MIQQSFWKQNITPTFKEYQFTNAYTFLKHNILTAGFNEDDYNKRKLYHLAHMSRIHYYRHMTFNLYSQGRDHLYHITTANGTQEVTCGLERMLSLLNLQNEADYETIEFHMGDSTSPSHSDAYVF